MAKKMAVKDNTQIPHCVVAALGGFQESALGGLQASCIFHQPDYSAAAGKIGIVAFKRLVHKGAV